MNPVVSTTVEKSSSNDQDSPPVLPTRAEGALVGVKGTPSNWIGNGVEMAVFAPEEGDSTTEPADADVELVDVHGAQL